MKLLYWDRDRLVLYYKQLITSATRHHLDPFADLRDLLRRLPTIAEDDLVNLLPNRWQPK